MSDVQTQIGIVPQVRGAGQASSEISRVYRALREGEMTVKEANTAMRDYTGTIYAQRRAVMLIRTEWRNQNAALFEGMRLMRATARLGRTMLNIFQTYTLMQTRMADKTRDVRNVDQELNRIQGIRKQVVEDLGVTNVHAMNLLDEERRLTERLAQEKRDLARAQRENLFGYAAIALALFDIIPNIVSIATHFRNMKILLESAWTLTALTSLSTWLTTLIGKAKTLWDLLSKLGGGGLPGGGDGGGGGGGAPPGGDGGVTPPGGDGGGVGGGDGGVGGGDIGGILGAAGVIAGAALTIGGIVYAATTPTDQLLEEIYSMETAGATGAGPDWGVTEEQLESDLPSDSELLGMLTGQTSLTRDQVEVVAANRRYEDYQDASERTTVVINQTNNIRTDEDAEITDRVVDRLAEEYERGLLR